MINKWEVFEMLKQNPKYLTKENLKKLETVNAEIIKEGCLEFLYSRYNAKLTKIKN